MDVPRPTSAFAIFDKWSTIIKLNLVIFYCYKFLIT